MPSVAGRESPSLTVSALHGAPAARTHATPPPGVADTGPAPTRVALTHQRKFRGSERWMAVAASAPSAVATETWDRLATTSPAA